jgi:hypothetical protein
MGKEKKEWVEKKVRFQPEEAQRIELAAHAARLPLAVYIRSLLATGMAPKPVPPPTHEESFGSLVLNATINGLTSNLSQVEQHSIQLGDPLSRLSGAEGAIQKLRSAALQIGLLNKAGSMSELEIKRVLKEGQPASDCLNFDLAKPLNRGIVVSNRVWRETLETVQSALAIQVREVQRA